MAKTPTYSEVTRMDIRDVVNDPEWQALRQGFVGTWKKAPKENVAALRKYIGPMTDPMKVRRVVNYLSGSGFRIGIISHPSISKLRQEVWRARDQLLAREAKSK